MFGRKGIYFTMDALLAGFLFVAIAIVLVNNPFYSQSTTQETFFVRDIATSIDSLKIGDVNSAFVSQEIANGNITDLNLSVLEVIGRYWALNMTSKATTLFEEVVVDSIPEFYGVRLSIDQQEIYFKDVLKNNVVVSNKMVAGIASGAPLTGASASAYLRRIRNKKTSTYHYFGGFIGQGNISFFIDSLPQDFSFEDVEQLYLQGDFNSNFEFFVNNISCYNSTITSSIDNFDLTSCSPNLLNATNNFDMEFESSVNNAFISGGFLRIDYRTDELQQNISLDKRKYYFPEIIGIANIYDSFYVPGELTELNIHMHYDSNYSTYISIGERIIEFDEFTAAKNITPISGTEFKFNITNQDLLDMGFDYEQLSVNTVPLRFASYEATSEVVTSGDVDIILITDFSSSMMRAVENWNMGNLGSKCEDVYEDPETRRTNLAKCINNEFVDSVLNYSGNRLWPVFMHQDEIKFYDNPEDIDAIKGYINSYPNGNGGSCISCAINKAYELLETYSNDSRKKVIVLMTDGVPTHCSDGSCMSLAVEYGEQICQGICSSPGNCPLSTRQSQCSACTSNPGAADNLYVSATRVVEDLNTTIYTVGFGPLDECDFAGEVLSNVSTIGNGTYQHSNNIEELRLIYDNISLEILTLMDQQNQTVSVQGNITDSIMYGDSVIDFKFNPIASSSPGKISVVVEEALTTCESTIEIPQGIDIIDAKVTSYSSNHWSDLVVVNNQTAFNLSDYYVPYVRLGDPFVIQVPVDLLVEGDNTIFIETGDSPENRTGCSNDNNFIYTALVPSVTSRTEVKSLTQGCTWNVSFEDGSTNTIPVPENYNGTNTCSYTPLSISYNEEDTYDVAMFNLLNQLDVRGNGEVFININQLDLEISTTLVQDIPYLWGPAIVSLEVWR